MIEPVYLLLMPYIYVAKIVQAHTEFWDDLHAMIKEGAE